MSCFRIVHKLKTGVVASYCMCGKNNHAPGVYPMNLRFNSIPRIRLNLAFIWLDSTRKIDKKTKDANGLEQNQLFLLIISREIKRLLIKISLLLLP